MMNANLRAKPRFHSRMRLLMLSMPTSCLSSSLRRTPHGSTFSTASSGRSSPETTRDPISADLQPDRIAPPSPQKVHLRWCRLSEFIGYPNPRLSEKEAERAFERVRTWTHKARESYRPCCAISTDCQTGRSHNGIREGCSELIQD